MVAKLHINAVLGEIQIEGEEKFVQQIYADLKDLLKNRIAKAQAATKSAADEAVDPFYEDGKEKKKRVQIKKSGPSCASRIAELQSEKFFTALKDNKNISEALATKGHNYEAKHISAALIHMTKTGKLRRIKKDGAWYYQNP